MDPMETRFSVNERIGTISDQVRQDRLALKVKALEQGHVGHFSGWLSLAGLQGLVGFGNGRAAQVSKVDRAASHPELVQPLKPEEQCC
jgi:hypothetical protein